MNIALIEFCSFARVSRFRGTLYFYLSLMKRTPNTSSLTKEYIESRISQELIVSKYLDIPLDVVKDCIEHNHLITSVFRDDDYNKSMGIQYNVKGRLKVRDFGGFGFFEDIYGVVSHVLSIAYNRKIETNRKEDFYFILKHIAYTFSDIIDGKEVDSNMELLIKDAINKAKSKKAIIEVVTRSWNNQDKTIWEKWGISISYLNTHFVVPVDQYYINRGVDTKPKYYYKAKDPCYAYIVGQNRQGVYLIKLYFPLRKRHGTTTKFVTNCNVLEGLYNLELDNYDYILITKSSKDRLSIGSHLTTHSLYGGANRKLNIGIINVPSENYKLKANEYEWLSNKLAKGGMMFSLFDFDTTGRECAKYMKETYGIPYLFITRGEFGLPDYKCKDFAELCERYDKNEINNFISETITYVRLKYRQSEDISETSDIEGMYFDSLPY